MVLPRNPVGCTPHLEGDIYAGGPLPPVLGSPHFLGLSLCRMGGQEPRLHFCTRLRHTLKNCKPQSRARRTPRAPCHPSKNPLKVTSTIRSQVRFASEPFEEIAQADHGKAICGLETKNSPSDPPLPSPDATMWCRCRTSWVSCQWMRRRGATLAPRKRDWRWTCERFSTGQWPSGTCARTFSLLRTFWSSFTRRSGWFRQWAGRTFASGTRCQRSEKST